jgi:hypothetical protein
MTQQAAAGEGTIEHRSIRKFELTAVAPEGENDSTWAAIVTTVSGERMLLSFSQIVAGQIFGQIGATMRQMTQEGKQVQIQSIPERVMAYNAVPMNTDEGRLVEILVQGDQSRRAFHGVMQPIAARSFAALLSGSAESSGPRRAN